MITKTFRIGSVPRRADNGGDPTATTALHFDLCSISAPSLEVSARLKRNRRFSFRVFFAKTKTGQRRDVEIFPKRLPRIAPCSCCPHHNTTTTTNTPAKTYSIHSHGLFSAIAWSIISFGERPSSSPSVSYGCPVGLEFYHVS